MLGANEPLRPVLFFIVMFAAPPETRDIPGIGGINKFIPMSIAMAGVITLLLPCLFQKRPPIARRGGAVGWAVAAFTALMAALAFRDTSVTDGLRIATVEFLTIAVIYFAVVKSIRTEKDMRAAILALFIPLMALATVALAEILMQWHFYTEIKRSWGIAAFHEYTRRAGSIRAFTSQGDPISYGIYIASALGLALGFFATKINRQLATMGLVVFAAALVATLSRGPWLAAAVAAGVFALTGPNAAGRTAQLGLIALVGGLALLATPFGGAIIDLIPFIGDSGAETISYREELLRTGAGVIGDHPLFGVSDPHGHPKMQSLIQGQGIVDIVNSYLSIGLHYGLTGLGLFLFAHLAAAASLWRAVGVAKRFDAVLAAQARGLLAAYCAYLAAISTTSSVGLMSEFGWILAALSVASARVITAAAAASSDVAMKAANDAVAAGDGRRPADQPIAAAKPAVVQTRNGPRNGPTNEPQKRPRLPAAQVPSHLRQYVRED